MRAADLFDEALHGVGVGHVQLVRMCHSAARRDLVGGGLGRAFVDVAHHDLGTPGGEGKRGGPTDAATRAGHRNQCVAEGFTRPTDLRPPQPPSRGRALDVIDQFGGGVGDGAPVRERRPVPGLEVAAPQQRHPGGRLVVAVPAHHGIVVIADQLNRHRHVVVAAQRGERANRVGAVDLQPVRRVDVECLGLEFRPGGVDGLQPAGRTAAHQRGRDDGNRERDPVAEPRRQVHRLGEPDRAVRAGQPATHERPVVVGAGPRDRGEGRHAFGGLGAAEVLPHPHRSPVVGQHVHGLPGAHRVDHRGQVIGEPVHPVGPDGLGHIGGAGAAVVVAHDVEPIAQLTGHAVPQHM